MFARHQSVAVAAAGSLLLALLWAACATTTDREVQANPFLNIAEGVGFVGDEACASCHPDEHAGYQEHGMARSFYRMSDSVAVEDFSGVVVVHPSDGLAYTAYRRGDGRFVQEEFQLDEAGRKSHSLVRTMDYVVGSGNAARTYLTAINGRLFELPLTWYTTGTGGRWDFSPGYRESNGRFDRSIPDRCMACHNGYSEPVPFVEGAFASLASGIGCERCHGPGDLHVDARLASEEAPDSVDYTIVNPRWLSFERRMDVCQQCHLSGAVSVQREGEEAFGYRPSRPLREHRAVFALADEDPHRVGVISHVDRMRQSACFVESGTLECTTCHDPHAGFRQAGPEYFDRTCRSCHPGDQLASGIRDAGLRARHAQGTGCYSCHMPSVEAADAPHASFTDHFIRVVRDADRITGEARAGAGDELRPYFDEERDDDATEGIAYVVYGRQTGDRASISRGAGLLAQALEQRPAQGEAQFLLGFARMQLGQVREAVPALREAVRLGPNVPERLNALAQAYERTGTGSASDTEALYRRALDVQPLAAEVRVNYGRFLEAVGRVGEAVTQYQRAARDAPALSEAHYNLGTVLARAGQSAEAVAPLREAVRLSPRDPQALMNLGALLAGAGDVAGAESLFRRAVVVAPGDANARANLALALAQRGDVAGALSEARAALAIDPGQPTARQVIAALGAN
jgi:Flp pilus assembly protein TadD